MGHPAIAVDDLAVRYGRVTAVAGASFTAHAGEVTVILGANGAGKTTTVETLEGLRIPASGSVRVLGLDPLDQGPELRRRMGAMLQGGGVQPGLKVGEAVRLEAAFHQRPADPGTVLERLGLTPLAGRTFRQLSGGEQQRLLLALALIPRPEVAFLDEPTSGVDLDGRRRIREIVAELAASGAAVLLTTHELDEAERMADRVVLIDHGRVRASGTLDDLCGGRADVRFRARPGLPVGGLAALTGGPAREELPGRYVVEVEPTPEQVATITRWLADQGEALADLRAGRRTLEEAVVELVGHAIADDGPGDGAG